MFYSVFFAMAGVSCSGFGDFFVSRLKNANWVMIALICLVGIGLTVALSRKHTKASRALARNFLLCTLLLSLAYFLGYNAMIYFMFAITALVAIIYQPELRDALVKVSDTRFNLSGKLDDSEITKYQELIETVCQAVMELSRSKTGALIVLERRSKLNDIVETGIQLDAITSTYLIRNIFYDKAPLHDGATIIRDCRVVASGCILPLTKRTDVDQELGTRHRAAIGMSEGSDAIVIVVSEESGKVSCAFASHLSRDFSFQALHAFLSKHLLNQDDAVGSTTE